MRLMDRTIPIGIKIGRQTLHLERKRLSTQKARTGMK